mgnify:CR=1 FL=1
MTWVWVGLFWVAAAGVVYAYIQISRSVTDLDARFEYNWRRAKEVGILRGAYQRFQPDQDQGVRVHRPSPAASCACRVRRPPAP